MGNHEATPWTASDYKDSAYTGGAYTYGHGSLRPDSGACFVPLLCLLTQTACFDFFQLKFNN
jgi:hypothetical protein